MNRHLPGAKEQNIFARGKSICEGPERRGMEGGCCTQSLNEMRSGVGEGVTEMWDTGQSKGSVS